MKNYTCGKCGLTFQGRQTICPHCDTIINYSDTVYNCGKCKKPFKGKKEKCPHCDTVIKYKSEDEIRAEHAKKMQADKTEKEKKAKENKKNAIIITICSVTLVIIIVVFSVWNSNKEQKARWDTYKSEIIETDILGNFQCTSTVMEGMSVDQEFTINSDNTFSYTIYEINSSEVMTSGKGKWKLQAERDTTWNFGEIKNIEVYNSLILYGYHNDNYTSFVVKDSKTLITIFNNLFSMGEGQVFNKVQ